ncbi:MAG: zinc ribbon domain-containing protein [Deltaproteobacteria bacterium]|nr:zinc ribbon domain-containing protein [Deltaproteobacteria bacterium]MBW2053559.1 zinc ribbon domain-containing protein [Deltaproteobacteria bacterium]MBW2142102.1 zinc ribbon domain-containing protein [Deltaproteobacteria bacterium]
MPLYNYRCRACDLEEERLAGIDNQKVICTECGEVMDRQISDDEALSYYFINPESQATHNFSTQA